MSEKVLLEAVLGFPAQRNGIFLARKKRSIGAGFFNGYGGGIEGTETPEAAMQRELQEEGGVTLLAMQKIALVDFHNTKDDGAVFRCRVHVFLITCWNGGLAETDEMGMPIWFLRNRLPLDHMMLADRDWLPVALAAEHPIYAQAWYGPHQREILRPTEIALCDEDE